MSISTRAELHLYSPPPVQSLPPFGPLSTSFLSLQHVNLCPVMCLLLETVFPWILRDAVFELSKWLKAAPQGGPLQCPRTEEYWSPVIPQVLVFMVCLPRVFLTFLPFQIQSGACGTTHTPKCFTSCFLPSGWHSASHGVGAQHHIPPEEEIQDVLRMSHHARNKQRIKQHDGLSTELGKNHLEESPVGWGRVVIRMYYTQVLNFQRTKFINKNK